jgi:hypothetical protein
MHHQIQNATKTQRRLVDPHCFHPCSNRTQMFPSKMKKNMNTHRRLVDPHCLRPCSNTTQMLPSKMKENTKTLPSPIHLFGTLRGWKGWRVMLFVT